MLEAQRWEGTVCECQSIPRILFRWLQESIVWVLNSRREIHRGSLCKVGRFLLLGRLLRRRRMLGQAAEILVLSGVLRV